MWSLSQDWHDTKIHNGRFATVKKQGEVMELAQIVAKVISDNGITPEQARAMADTPLPPVHLSGWRDGFDERFDSCHPAMWDFRKLSAAGAEEEFRQANEWLAEFISDFDTGKRLPSLLITGDFGTGKTCLAGALVRECQRAGACAGLMTQTEIIRGLWSPDAKEKRETKYEVYERRQMLVVDEFISGCSALSQGQQQELSALLRARAARGLSTVLTSNCPSSMLGTLCPGFLYAAVAEMRPLRIRLACPCRRLSLEDIGDSWKS